MQTIIVGEYCFHRQCSGLLILVRLVGTGRIMCLAVGMLARVSIACLCIGSWRIMCLPVINKYIVNYI